MAIVTIKYQGKVYQRVINRKRGFYVMESKGLEYWFAKDIILYPKTSGWHLINSVSLPQFMLELIAAELERLNTEKSV